MLRTVNVPPLFEHLFEEAERYVTRYFQTLRADASKGTIEISDDRFVLVRGAALSIEFFDIIKRMFVEEGEEKAASIARQLLFDISHALGRADAQHFHEKRGLADPIAKLSAGPIFFAHSGWAFVDISDESRPEPNDNYYLLYDHPYSFEADAWLRAGRQSDFPVCVMNAGYSSGWCEESFGVALVASEIQCRAKGDPACRFIMAPPDRIEDHISRHLALPRAQIGKQLAVEIPDFLRRDWAKKVRVLTADLGETRDRLAAIVESSRDAIISKDLSGTVTSWNRGAERLFGCSASEMIGRPMAVLVPADRKSEIASLIAKVLSGEEVIDYETVRIRKDGTPVDISIDLSPIKDDKGAIVNISSISRDITPRKEAEASLRRANRALRTRSACNQMLIAVDTEGQLLPGACHAIVESGGYSMAFIGRAESDPAKTLRIIAQAGFEGVDLSTLRASWADDEYGCGAMARAIRTGKPAVFTDIQNDAAYAPWREEVRKHGNRSAVGLPIRTKGEIFGALGVFATEVNAFGGEEVELLQELAADIGYGLEALRIRQEREDALHTLKIRDMAVASALSAIAMCDPEGRITYANRAALDMWGYEDLANVVGRPAPTFVQEEAQGHAVLEELKQKGRATGRITARRRDGQPMELQYAANLVADTVGKPVGMMFALADITDRIHAEAERREHAAKLREALIQTIKALALTIEKRDPYTSGHQERVAELARAIARNMGLSEDRAEGLYTAGLIHDIGKIQIPAEILAKPGKLSVQEMGLIETHAEAGYDIVKNVPLPWPVAKIILQHHERLDGSGYPSGLKGDAIMMEARILAVADVVEAMASHRPYRPSRGIAAALAEIVSKKGTEFDASAVDVCVKLMESGKFTLASKQP